MSSDKKVKVAAPHKPAHGFDNSGHMDPAHAQRLLELSREGKESDDEAAFVKGTSTNDDLAEELAEAAVASMTTGEDELATDLDATVAEEQGGPFTETSADVEFAGGTDESNIEGATREPFPLANSTKNG
jgi:hypothetical protein